MGIRKRMLGMDTRPLEGVKITSEHPHTGVKAVDSITASVRPADVRYHDKSSCKEKRGGKAVS